MIKTTFLNLNETKRNAIISAAKKEFASKSLHEASINQIIKDAEIARGSFYNYFDDINDIYFYILDNFRNKMDVVMEKSLIKSNGNIFTTFIDMFDFIVEFTKDEENKSILKNFFLNMSHTNKNYLLEKPDLNKMHERINSIKGLINIKILKISDPKELMVVIEILFETLINTVMQYFMSNTEINHARNQLIKKIEIIKYGAYKEE